MKLSQWNFATNSGKKRPVVARWDTRDDLYLTTEHQISCLKNDVVYYSKRPTQASAFIAKSVTPIAALSTPTGVFALSYGNTKLEYWSSSDATSETLTTLPSPAVDLEFCASYVYGSCEDGNAYVYAGGTLEIVPSVIEGGTMLKTVLLQSSNSSVGMKRKSKMESMKLYQIFQAKDGIVLAVHELIVEDTTIQVTRSDTKVLSKEYCDIKVVGVHQDQIGFCYTSETHRYFGSLSLTNAQISSLALPAGASAVALMGPFLVVLRNNLLLFLDSLRGGIIDEKALPHTFGDCIEGSIDIVAKERRLAIIYGQDAVQVATTSLSSSTGGNLASLLSNSLQTSMSAFHVRQFVHSPEASLEKGISALIDAYEHIVRNKSTKDGVLLQAFESALECLAPAHNNCDNPQEQSPKKRSKTSANGVHHNGMNGHSVLAPMDIPTALVECATELAVRLLCVDKLALSDSTILLRRLVRTKKVLSRKHFPSLSKILFALRRSPVYNASDLLTDMFAYCPDVSELQLVVSLRFGIRSLTVDDMQVDATNGGERHSNGPKEQKAILKGIRTSLCHLLRQILSYSSCNDSLLRRALADVLSTTEMGITLNLLVELLKSHSDVNVKVQALQWLLTLCDCLNTKRDDSINIGAIRSRITSYVKNIQGTIVLKGVLDSLLDAREGLKHSDSFWTGKLPPYQIERLTF